MNAELILTKEKQMQCDCIEQFDKKYAEQTGDPEANLKVGFIKDGNTLKVAPYLTAAYRRKKKNGEFESRKRTTCVTINYCPFCGKSAKGETNV